MVDGFHLISTSGGITSKLTRLFLSTGEATEIDGKHSNGEYNSPRFMIQYLMTAKIRYECCTKNLLVELRADSPTR